MKVEMKLNLTILACNRYLGWNLSPKKKEKKEKESVQISPRAIEKQFLRQLSPFQA
jgi:hypothetical protein